MFEARIWPSARGTCVRIRARRTVHTCSMLSSHMEPDRDFETGQGLWVLISNSKGGSGKFRVFQNGKGEYCSPVTPHWRCQMIHGLWRAQTLPAQHIHTPITICHVWALPTVLKRDLFCVLFAGNVANSMLNSKIKPALDCFIEYLPVYLGKLHFRILF